MNGSPWQYTRGIVMNLGQSYYSFVKKSDFVKICQVLSRKHCFRSASNDKNPRQNVIMAKKFTDKEK